ncbi:nuclear transport factor 2 family protein [Vibrio apostichopi]|uniref:nuclear transport factor 2 family protein n=1 Tax=Vibrio apostichopi TaxID=3035453 RepID=UPI0025734FDA|nr:hypothetical protein [Vibrio sp. FE10]
MTSILEINSEDSKNLRQVKSIYSALKSSDIDSLKAILVDEPIWDVSPGFPEGKVYRGLPEILGVFYTNLRSQAYSFAALPDSFVDSGDKVVALGHYQVIKTQDADPILIRFCHAWSIDTQGNVKGVWQVADSASFYN